MMEQPIFRPMIGVGGYALSGGGGGGNADTLQGHPASDFALAVHTHDDRYYTETEIGVLLSGKSDIGHAHTIYAQLAGRVGGQTLIGGTGSGEDLILGSTSHDTKGKIKFGTKHWYDEANDQWLFHNVLGDNYERAYFKWDTNIFKIGTDASGSGNLREVMVDAGLYLARGAYVSVDGYYLTLITSGSVLADDHGALSFSNQGGTDIHMLSETGMGGGTAPDLHVYQTLQFSALHRVMYMKPGTLQAAVADQVEFAVQDYAAGDARLYIQSELGKPIVVGKDEIQLYNTADITTNYERAFSKWSSNIFKIGTEKGGTGVSRDLWLINALGDYIKLYGSGDYWIRMAGAPANFFTMDNYGGFQLADSSGGGLNSNSGRLFISSNGGMITYSVNGVEHSRMDTVANWFGYGGTSLPIRISNFYAGGGVDYERAYFKWDSNIFKIGTEADGTGIVRPIAIETDVDVNGKLTGLLPVATIETDMDDWFVGTTDMKNGAYTLAHTSNGGAATFLKISHFTVSELDTLGKIVIVGLDQNGDPATEDIIPIADDFVESVNCYSSITSITGVNWAIDGGNGAAAADNLAVGISGTDQQFLIVPSSLCKGHVLRILHVGQLQLLPVVVGAVVTIYVTLDELLSITPDGADRIVFEGTELADGAAIQSSATAAGDYITLFGDSAAGWTEAGNRGFEVSP